MLNAHMLCARGAVTFPKNGSIMKPYFNEDFFHVTFHLETHPCSILSLICKIVSMLSFQCAIMQIESLD